MPISRVLRLRNVSGVGVAVGLGDHVHIHSHSHTRQQPKQSATLQYTGDCASPNVPAQPTRRAILHTTTHHLSQCNAYRYLTSNALLYATITALHPERHAQLRMRTSTYIQSA